MDAPATLGIMEILGIAASASLLAGWRLYIVILGTGLAMRSGMVPLPEHLESLQVLANPWVLGIAGLMGAGRTELTMSIFGRSYGEGISGEVLIGGKPADTSTVARAIRTPLVRVAVKRRTRQGDHVADIDTGP